MDVLAERQVTLEVNRGYVTCRALCGSPEDPVLRLDIRLVAGIHKGTDSRMGQDISIFRLLSDLGGGRPAAQAVAELMFVSTSCLVGFPVHSPSHRRSRR